MRHLVKSGILLSFLVVNPTAGFGSLMTYEITVNVTTAPNAPGSFPTNQWSFGSLPSVAVGTFEADNAFAGQISNLQLTVGGLDIATSHSFVVGSFFDPVTLTLQYGAYDPTALESFVGFNVSYSGNQPSNYVAAIQNTDSSVIGPPDPYSPQYTQNWAGTFSISPVPAVPEPGSLTLLGLASLGAFGWMKARQVKAAVVSARV
jgi:hypothetical protein